MNDGAKESTSPTERVARDIKSGMVSLRDLVVVSAVYATLPSLGLYLDSDVATALAPVAAGLAIVAGSGGAVFGYLWLLPSEKDRELDMMLRSASSVKLLILGSILLAALAHLLLWLAIEIGSPVYQLSAVAFVSFLTLGFYGLVVSGLSLLRTQRLVWQIVGRRKMHRLVTAYHEAKKRKRKALEKETQEFEEDINYSNMMMEATEALSMNPNDTEAQARLDMASDWFLKQDQRGSSTTEQDGKE